MSRFRGLPRALWVGGGLGRCEPQVAPEKAPNGVRCPSRCWPITSLAVDLGFWQVKDLGVFGGGRDGVGVGRAVDWDCCRERMPGGHRGGGEECRKGRQGFNGPRRRHWRERPVSGNASEEPAEAMRTTSVWNVKRREKPGRFGRQGRLGKGAWAATSKGPRGIPGQLGRCALRRAPEPGVVQLLRGRPTHQNPQRPPPRPTWTLGVWGTSCARESPLAARDSFQGLCLAARGIPSD